MYFTADGIKLSHHTDKSQAPSFGAFLLFSLRSKTMGMNQSALQPVESNAAAVARGVSRLFLRNRIMVQSEVPLRNQRRTDLMGINAKGEIIIVEIKCAPSNKLS